MVHSLHQWIRRLFTAAKRPARFRAPPTFRPTLEILETRVTPSVTFAGQQTFAVANEPQAVAVGDFNGDGKPDIVTAENNPNTGAGNISVFLNNTSAGATAPSFAAPVTFAVSPNPSALAVGDFNDDGKPDLVIVSGTTVVAVLLNTTPTGATAPTFAAPVTFAVGSSPNSVAVGDFNGDGLPDIAVANGNANDVSVLMNTTVIGSTTPSFATQALFAAGEAPYSVTVGDFNDDGKPDLVVASAGDPNTVSVLLDTTATGATAPTFAPRDSFAVGNEPLSVALGDFNGDGRLDLAVANFNFNAAGTVSVLLNTTAAGATTAAFTSQVTFAVGSGPISTAVGDFNGDGKPDLVTVNQRDGTVSVLLNTTTAGVTAPTFAAPITFVVGAKPLSVAVGDFNGDGRPDLAVANEDDDTVSVLRDTTAPQTVVPTLGGQKTFAVGVEPISVAPADFNGDGKPDLAVANFHIGGAGTVSVLLNNTPAGTTVPSFGAQFTVPVGSEPISVAVGDFNDDGKPDLAVANFADGTVSVLLNTTAAGATAPSFAAAVTFAVGSGPYSVAVADFNDDGRPDLAVANEGGGTVSVLLNTTAAGAAAPTFAPQTTFTVGANPISVAVGDFNGDSRPDLAVANLDDGTVSVLLNKTAARATTPSFAAQTTFAVGASPHWMAVGDFNGDGKSDIVVANDRGSGTVSVLLDTAAAGAAAPSFAAPVTFAVGSQPESVAVGDFNGDGTTDLAVANSGDNTVSVLSDATAGGPHGLFFAVQRTFAVGSDPLSVAAADFNRDGRPDLVTANYNANTVSVLLDTTAPFAVTTPVVVADIHGLGIVEYNRLTNAWVPLNTVTSADVSLLAADGLGDVVVDYPGYGVWEYRASTAAFTLLNGTDVPALAMDALGDVVVTFSHLGVWEYRPSSSTPTQLNVSDAYLLAMDGLGNVFADFRGYGVNEYRPATGAWTLLNGTDVTLLAVNASGEVVVNFPGYGVASYTPLSGWRILNGTQAQSLAVDAYGDVVASYHGFGVAEYRPGASGGSPLNVTDAAPLAMDAMGDVYADFTGYGVWEFDPFQGWHRLNPGDVSLLVVA